MGRKNKRCAGHTDRGASLVEFAIVAPLLILLLFGIIEFGWLFGQYNDLKHGAREGARYSAVNGGDDTAIRAYVCNTMEGLSAGMTQLEVSTTDGASGTRGETGSIRVRATMSSLSGLPFITTFLPSTLVSDISFRLEQNSIQWGSFGYTTVTC
jgi:Flp pilus assembly protein TadG